MPNGKETFYDKMDKIVAKEVMPKVPDNVLASFYLPAYFMNLAASQMRPDTPLRNLAGYVAALSSAALAPGLPTGFLNKPVKL